MRYLIPIILSIFFQGPEAASEERLQVEGMMLGYQPNLADGIRVVTSMDSKELRFEAGRRCLQNVKAERKALALNGRGLDEEWLRSANGLAADFYRDNLAKEADKNVLQLMFLPMVLSPKPISVSRTEWTPAAAEILAKQGWPALEQFCGTHFVEAVGEENYVIYSIQVSFPDRDMRMRTETVSFDNHNQSPALVLANLHRMRRRFEFVGPGRSVTLDILQVGGREVDVNALRAELAAQNIEVFTEKVSGSMLSRVKVTCSPNKLEPCQSAVQTYLDFQFQRLNFHGEGPSFTPARFRIAPFKHLQLLN